MHVTPVNLGCCISRAGEVDFSRLSVWISRSDVGAHSPMSRVLATSDLPALLRVLENAAHNTYSLEIELELDPHLVRTLK